MKNIIIIIIIITIIIVIIIVIIIIIIIITIIIIIIIIIIIVIIIVIIITIFVPFFLGLKFVQEDVIVLIEGSHINTSDTCALSAVTGIPVISLSRDTRPINECKKSVQMHPGYKTYAHATLDIVNTFQWKKLALLYDGKNLSYGFYFTKELCSCQVNEIALFFGLFVLFVLFLFFALKFASYRQSLSAYRKDIPTDFMLQNGAK